MMKKINVQNDVESRRRIAEAFPRQEKTENMIKEEVQYAQSEEIPEHPAIEAATEPQTKKKGRRKTQGDMETFSI